MPCECSRSMRSSTGEFTIKRAAGAPPRADRDRLFVAERPARQNSKSNQTVGGRDCDRRKDEIDARESSDDSADRRQDDDECAIKNPGYAANKGIRLNAGDGGGKNIGGVDVARCARQNNLIAQIFDVRRGWHLFFVLLRGKQQFVCAKMTRSSRHIRINQHRPVGSNWNSPSVRQRNERADVDLHFRRRDAPPEKRRLQGKRWNHFASILKE